MYRLLLNSIVLGCTLLTCGLFSGCAPEKATNSTASEGAHGGPQSHGGPRSHGGPQSYGAGNAPIRVIGFDEHDDTLQAILDGKVYGTVVQNPYMYGYKSIELLKRLAEGAPPPAGDEAFIDFPTRKITIAEVAEFWKDKNDKLEQGKGEAAFTQGLPSFAYVTNGIDPFWTVAAAGAIRAGRDLKVNVLVRQPPEGIGDQQRMLEDLLVQDGVQGIAVSPIDPANQEELLNRIGESKTFITQDSDAPNTNRLAYIGTENYKAGRMAGQLIKEAMPEGGSVMIFVGRLGQLNAEQRRQGVIDELLDRDPDPTRRDPNDAEIKGDKYTILGTKLDNFDKAKAKQNAQDTISKYPNVGCMVGLFAYNPPMCLQAVEEAGRTVRPEAP